MESLDTYFDRASEGLKVKMQKSIDLICKASRLALRYDNENGYWLNFSGGKDSQALYHITQLAHLQSVIRGGYEVRYKPHFAPTSVDPPQVIKFIRRTYPDVEFLPLKQSIYDVAVKKGILPSQTIRWCCAEFKESTGAGKVNLIGIRKEESVRRAKRNEVEIKSRKFSGNIDEFNQYRMDKHFNPTKRGRKPKVEKPIEFHPYDEAYEETLTSCINGKDSILISPIIEWTEKDVWEFLNIVMQVPHCELYDKGYKRIGCIMCPMSSHKQKIKEAQDFPYVKAKWLNTIRLIRRGGGITRQTYLPQEQHNGKSAQARSKVQQSRMEQSRKMGGWIQCPEPNHWRNAGFSDGSSSICESEEQENEIAENILDWWISGVSYDKWYANKFQQGSLDL